MKRTFKFTATIGLSVFSMAGVFGTGEAIAQHPRILKRTTNVPACGCGQWTCPACQQSNCSPANQAVNPSPQNQGSSQSNGVFAPQINQPSMSDQPLGLPQSNSVPPSTSVLPESSSSMSTTGGAQSSSGIDFSQIASNDRSDTGQQRSFGSSSYLNNAVEFQGDYFGGQVYSLNGLLIPSNNNGTLKLAENVSPIPRDRIFFNYSLFNRVPLTPGGIDVSRFSPGFEKTFLDKQASLEVRTPFSTTLDNTIITDGSSSTSQLKFGNMFLSLKGILIGTDCWAITGGTSLILPTAQDTRIFTPNGQSGFGGQEILNISNESVHLMPFLGAVATPGSPRERIEHALAGAALGPLNSAESSASR